MVSTVSRAVLLTRGRLSYQKCMAVLDCIPEMGTTKGRESWLTLACVAIFFNSLKLTTYVKKAKIAYGKDLSEIERITVNFGLVGAAWVFAAIAKEGVDRRDSPGWEEDPERDTRLDHWLDILKQEWVPTRYRFPFRFVLHFGCAILATRRLFTKEKDRHEIREKKMQEMLAKDVQAFLGDKARDVFVRMMEMALPLVGQNLGEEPATMFFSYPGHWFEEKRMEGPWHVPGFTDEFNTLLKSLVHWKVRIS